MSTSRASCRCWNPSSSKNTSTGLSRSILSPSTNRSAPKSPLQHLDFIARSCSSAISAAQNPDALPFGLKLFRQVQHHRRLPCSAHGQIADADHWSLEPLFLKHSFLIQHHSESCSNFVKYRERP